MVIGCIFGDYYINKFGGFIILKYGVVLFMIGIILIIFVYFVIFIILGFFFIGLGIFVIFLLMIFFIG